MMESITFTKTTSLVKRPMIQILHVYHVPLKDRVVDELIVSFTHNMEIDFILPGIPPTGKHVEIPTVVVMKFHGDKIAHEHIYWDQASVLAQIGLIDTKILPITGIKQTQRLLEVSKKKIEAGKQ